MLKLCQNLLSMCAGMETIAKCRTTEEVFGELVSYSIHADVNNPFSAFDDQFWSDWRRYAHFLLSQAPCVLQHAVITCTQLDAYNPQQAESQVNKHKKQEISNNVHPTILRSDNDVEANV